MDCNTRYITARPDGSNCQYTIGTVDTAVPWEGKHEQTNGAWFKPSEQHEKIAVASMIGTLIEFYDFLIYGTAAALVFAKDTRD